MIFKYDKIIKDPIHGYIHLNSLENRIINTKIFLRLQKIKQSPTAYLTYPSHYVNRFVHSLGTMELAGKILFFSLENSNSSLVSKLLDLSAKELEVNQDKIRMVLLQTARLAGLLHDIGHTPLSHIGESAIKNNIKILYERNEDFNEFIRERNGEMPQFHEFNTYSIIKYNGELNSIFERTGFDYKNILLKIFGPNSKGIHRMLYRIISYDVDADRSDFLIRDGSTSGIDFGHYDIVRLVESMSIYLDDQEDMFYILPSTAALSTVEAFIIERYKLYKWLCFHPHVILTDTALSQLIRKLIDWSWNPDHPLGNLIKIDDLHYSQYVIDDLPFDDEVIYQRLKEAYIIGKKNIGEESKRINDIDYAMPLLRIVLFREKFSKAIFKNISEYKAFDIEMKEKIRKDRLPYHDILPDEPLLNKYAKNISGTIPIPEEERFDKILANEDQFILETEKTDFEPYSYKLSEIKRPIAGNGKMFVEKEYRSIYYLIDKKSGKKLYISDLSQTVKQLLTAWKNDMQLFIYIVRFRLPGENEWKHIIDSSKDKIKSRITEFWKNDKLR
jgi:HD superfamily phosphohydrolase